MTALVKLREYSHPKRRPFFTRTPVSVECNRQRRAKVVLSYMDFSGHLRVIRSAELPENALGRNVLDLSSTERAICFSSSGIDVVSKPLTMLFLRGMDFVYYWVTPFVKRLQALSAKAWFLLLIIYLSYRKLPHPFCTPLECAMHMILILVGNETESRSARRRAITSCLAMEKYFGS